MAGASREGFVLGLAARLRENDKELDEKRPDLPLEPPRSFIFLFPHYAFIHMVSPVLVS